MVLRGISTSFDALSPSKRQVAHALLTRPPLEYFEASFSVSPLDLHVLGTPPAFVLSQDQTLVLNPVLNLEVFPQAQNSFRIDCLSLDMTPKNHVRVLLDSVSFSRICVAREQRSLTTRLVYQDTGQLSTPF